MKTLRSLLAASAARAAAPAAQATTSITHLPDHGDGIDRLDRWYLQSAFLPDDRQISVYLPEAYATEPERRFPVLYLHDGQNLFDGRTAYLPGRTWRAGETADRLVREGRLPPVVLVGVANTGIHRMPEYTPTRDFRLGGGDGPLYGRVLVEELKPWMDRTYRTLPGCAETGVAGSSLGGLISLWLGLRYPQVFGRLGVLSPSIWWDHREILMQVRAIQNPPHCRIWLDIGTGEGQRHVQDTEMLYRLLVKAGWQPGKDLQFSIIPGALHDEDAWAARFDQVLLFLFGR